SNGGVRGLTQLRPALMFRAFGAPWPSAPPRPRQRGRTAPKYASRTGHLMSHPTAAIEKPRPPDCNAALVLADGTVFWGRGLGATGQAVGEVCFNTSITGYQEILTDPSYAGQIITFTFPHIGNVGANPEDVETTTPAARGLVLRTAITEPANYRATQSLDYWLKSHGIVGLSGVDTRRLTRPGTSCGISRTGSSCRTGRAIRPRPANTPCRCCAN